MLNIITMADSDDKTGSAISINVRVSPEIDKKVMELIAAGKHTTKSDVLKTALMEYLFRQQVMDKIHQPPLHQLIRGGTSIKTIEN